MFGVVPKPLWERVAVPDERNRIDNACRCLLVRSGDAVVLIDTGCGERFDERARDIFAVDNEVSLPASLADAGVDPAEITHVLFTHLHFDHSAGALQLDGDRLRPRFPQARHLVQRGEWEDARAGRSIMRSSYVADDLAALAGVDWQFLHGDVTPLPGLRVEVTGGHTAHHQAVLVEGSRHTLWFPADLLPLRAHLRPYWIMAYDMHPHDTLIRRQADTRRALDGGWIVAWDHDPHLPFSRFEEDARGGLTAVDWERA